MKNKPILSWHPYTGPYIYGQIYQGQLVVAVKPGFILLKTI